jgi:STE24 endopeptidase
MRLIGFAAFAAAFALAGPALAQSGAALPFDPDEATRQWLDTMGAEATARSNAYFEGTYWIQFVGPLIGLAVAFAFLQLGFADKLRTWLKSTVKVYFFVVILFSLVYSLIGSIVSFPWDYWVGFQRQHDFNLSTQDFGHWFSEYLMQAGIGLAIGSVAIALLYLIISVTKKTWWIWGTLGVIAFSVVLQVAFPVYIAPLFNTYTPMEQGELRDQVLGMAQANGVPADNVYIYDRSRQTNSISANVSGFMGTTRISIADTLINRGGPGQVRAVLGHEIGHYVLNHTVSLLVMISLLTAIVFALANILFNRLSAGERWGIKGISDPAGMPLLFSVVGFLFLLATPIQNNITRFHEAQADIFGINASREPDAWAQSALLLSEYRKMEPTPFEEWFFYDHPSGYARIHMAMEWKAHHMALGDYPMGPGGPPPGWHPDFTQPGGAAAAPPAAPAATATPAAATPAPSPAEGSY